MDTNIGTIVLTENQNKNFPFVKPNPVPFKGFCIWEDGKIVGVSDSEPTVEQIQNAVLWFQNLPEVLTTEYLVANFNSELAIGREAQVFDEGTLIRFMPVSYTINELIRYKNFWGGIKDDGSTYPGLKQVGHSLVQLGQITQADYDALNGILEEQGIDLDAK